MHSENGVLGVGPAPGDNEVDWDLINAGKQPITLVTGGSYVHHTDSFLMIRGGHLDLALLGAFEVSEKGDLANWTTDDPGFPPGVGGAMDLAVGAKEIRVLVEHTTKSGAPRIRRQCGYPLTAASVVRRIYTDLAVIDVTPEGLVVREMVEDIDFPACRPRPRRHCARPPTMRPLRAPAVSRLFGDRSVPFHLLVAADFDNLGDRAVGRTEFDRDLERASKDSCRHWPRSSPQSPSWSSTSMPKWWIAGPSPTSLASSSSSLS